MEKLYERADIYDLIENEDRSRIVRNDWETLLVGRKVERSKRFLTSVSEPVQ